jgi:tRNA modification GTPase
VYNPDTIAAIATPLGTGGVGIIRVSGPHARNIARRIFQPGQKKCSWESHHLYHGDLLAADGKTILDEVLISLMYKPHSFTGEDVLEINCHGSPLIMQSILAQLVEMGCRLAAPGEFTQRAFFNNRLDLAQAEALAGIVAAQSEKSSTIALAQLKGALSGEMENLRLLLIEALAILEAAIDFPEDVSAAEAPQIPPQIDIVVERLQLLLNSYQTAKIYSEGINVIIVGKPNVGKSSLLNTLTGRKRAIVTEIPGTTRDFLTDTINIRGIPVNIVDTAGIRQPQNAIEEQGIELVWENLANAGIAIILLDGSKPLTEEDTDIITRISKSNHLVAINKRDLPPAWDKAEIKKFLPDGKILNISAKFKTGIDELKNAVLDSCLGRNEEYTGTVLITNMRHKLALEKALAEIAKAKESITRGMSPEFAVLDLREALDSLDQITGKKINDEILDKIFSSFCIGK